MRRAIWTAMLCGIVGLPTVLQADSWYTPQPPVHVIYSGRYGCPYGYSNHGGYGRHLRGGYGRNGYAPVFGPVWGPTAFMPGAGKGADLRPHGSYVRPLGPEMMIEPGVEIAQPPLPAEAAPAIPALE